MFMTTTKSMVYYLMNTVSFVSEVYFKLYRHNDYSTYSIAYFVVIWMSMGNLISVSYNAGITIFTDQLNVSYLLLYLSAVLLVFIALFKELSSLASRYVIIIIVFQLFLFITFVYAPPRNADAMRVWLAKIYDILLNGEKILRPYAHYNTPDAFTLFHLPLVQIGDGQLFQLSIFTCFASVLILLIKICKYYNSEYLTYSCLFLFIFNPFITLSSTVILSDMPIILSVAGIIYSILIFSKNIKMSFWLSFVFMAYALNIKYNALMFVPAYGIWILINFKKLISLIDLKIFLFLFYLSIHAIYPYITNYFYIGNPVWPALTNIFPANIPSWDIAANNLTQPFLNHEINFSNFIISFFNLLTMPHHINPIVILLIPFVFQKFKYVSYMPSVIVSSYFLFLWIMMPRFGESEKERYILYLFPIIIPYGLIGFTQLITKFRHTLKEPLLFLIVGIPTLLYFSFNVYYAKDSLYYAIFENKKLWHKHTWYYNEYNWINENITLNNQDQIMVYSRAQVTSYLRKRYINIDELSGYFKEDKIYKTITNYEAEIKKHNIAYVFVDYNALDKRNLKKINEMVVNGRFTVLKNFNTFISSSRLLDRGDLRKTVFYKVNI